MRFRPRLLLAAIPPLVGGAVFTAMPVTSHASAQHHSVTCQSSALCTEVHDWRNTFEYYTGHDEPSVLFYSNTPGSGNHMTYQLKLPTQPATMPNATGTGSTTWDFQLHPAFWFGMAMCDPESYPEVTQVCKPDSDSNIKPMAQSPGVAFMEMQFYPPGWTAWPNGVSCDASHWCAAMTIDSLSEDPIHGTVLNNTCADQVGVEYVNFAWITKNGVPNGPANPVDATLSTFTPGSNNLLMNQGDVISVAMKDTTDGLRIDLTDSTAGTHGFMVASKHNGFAGVQYAPRGTSCNAVPQDFHPMFSTSQPPTMQACTPAGAVCAEDGTGTRVQWAAHSYNIAFSDEIGHFDWCSHVAQELDSGVPGAAFLGDCAIQAKENSGIAENADSDDQACFNGNLTTDYVAGGDQIPGCLGSNEGFDGASYLAADWPNGTNDGVTVPTPIEFTSPLTGTNDSQAYGDVAYEADIPRITGLNVTDWSCSRVTGANCNNPPLNDNGDSAFYPTFAPTGSGACMYKEGNFDNPTTQYGTQVWKLVYLVFGGGGAHSFRFNDNHNDTGAAPIC
jgi:hypothetical protein